MEKNNITLQPKSTKKPHRIKEHQSLISIKNKNKNGLKSNFNRHNKHSMY